MIGRQFTLLQGYSSRVTPLHNTALVPTLSQFGNARSGHTEVDKQVAGSMMQLILEQLSLLHSQGQRQATATTDTV